MNEYEYKALHITKGQSDFRKFFSELTDKEFKEDIYCPCEYCQIYNPKKICEDRCIIGRMLQIINESEENK